MSLKKFVKSPDVRQLIDEYFSIPKVTLGVIKATRITENPRIVGAAFDYVLRFMITRLNQNRVKSMPWVSESFGEGFDFPAGLQKKIKSHTTLARNLFNRYLVTGIVTDELLESSLHLALIDAVYRSGDIDIDIDRIEKVDIDDLRQLIAITDSGIFKAENICFLNPTFGIGSFLVGGADADLIIDNTLIDIKTVQANRISLDDIRQLIGYYFLSRIGTINDSKTGHEIANLGIYSSRHGILRTFSISSITRTSDLAEFTTQFVQLAIESRLGISFLDKTKELKSNVGLRMYREYMKRNIARSERLMKALSMRPYPHVFYAKYQRLLIQTPKATYKDYLQLVKEIQKNRIGKT